MRQRARSRIAGPDANGGYSILRKPNAACARELRALGAIDRLSITRPNIITAQDAQRISASLSVRWLWLWCDVTRAAMSHLIAIPGLEVVDVLWTKGIGRLSGFAHAASLRTFRANSGLRANDVVAIAECRRLRQLGIQRADLTPRALDALVASTRLELLDIERTAFDDAMAERLSESASLNWLEVGATKLTGRGLRSLTRIKRMRGLDLWATPIAIEDFELLREFPALEYVSIGGYIDAPLDGTTLVPLLLSLPALKSIWLDGVALDQEQATALEQRFERVRIT